VLALELFKNIENVCNVLIFKYVSKINTMILAALNKKIDIICAI